MKKPLINNIMKSGDGLKDLVSKTIAQNSVVKGVLGVDMGTDSIKALWLDSAPEGLKVMRFAVEKVADKNYRDALSRALKKVGPAAELPVVISVSGQGVISRLVEMPMMNRSELDSAMKFEVEKYVPFPLAEVAVDYTVVKELKDKAKISVLVAAAKNEVIQKKYKVAKELNLNLKAVDLDCMALVNFFTEVVAKKNKEECFGIINIGKSATNLNIVSGGFPSLSRDIFIGGDDITKSVKDALELDLDGAEKLKINPGVKKEELSSAWEQVLHNLASEIRVSLDYFESCGDRAVEKIYICGGSSRLAGLCDYLKQHLGIEVKDVDYISALKIDDSVDLEGFKANKDLLLIACGLALPR